MHIEPGLVDATKIVLSYATAAAAGGYALKLAADTARKSGVLPLVGRTLVTTVLVLSFFEALPHYPVGVSEVHFIFGSTLFLLFGVAPAALGLALGLLAQSVFLSPADLPQYGMNMTTLLVPLFAVDALARRVIEPGTPYVELKYTQALALSTTFQAGVVAWVAFWAFYGRGFEVDNLAAVGLFGSAYAAVILIEPVVDLAVLFLAKLLHGQTSNGLFSDRLHKAA